MNYIWFILIASAIVFGFANGKTEAVSSSILSSIKSTIDISIYIIGIMTFWMGIMKIAEKSGLVEVISKALIPIGKRLFPQIPNNKEGNETIGAVAFNFSANALGLGNAATPMGIKAITKMQEFNIDKTSASNSMCMLLAMNTAGFQLIPVTVIGILAAAGTANPTEIIIPTLIVTTISFSVAIIIAKIFEKIWTPQTQTEPENVVENATDKGGIDE